MDWSGKMTKKERFKALIAEMEGIRDTTTDEYVKFILTYLIKKWG